MASRITFTDWQAMVRADLRCRRHRYAVECRTTFRHVPQGYQRYASGCHRLMREAIAAADVLAFEEWSRQLHLALADALEAV
jgi:hypothetical protein